MSAACLGRFLRRGAAAALCAALLRPGPAWAQAAAEYSLTSAAIKMVGVLVLVLGLLMGLLYLMRKLSPRLSRRTAAGREMDLLAQYPLGPKKILAVVRVGGQLLLLGVTETNINLLTEITDPEIKDRLIRQEAEPGQGFGSILKKAGQRFKEGPEK